MQLLTKLFTAGSAEEAADRLQALVPRLWPFFRHTLTSVRLATVRCLSSLLATSTSAADWLTPPLLSSGLQLAFQNLVLESNADVLRASQVLHLLESRTGRLA